MSDFLAAYSDESIYQKNMTEQMNEEFRFLREENKYFFAENVEGIEYVTFSNGVLLFMDQDNMYFVVVANYLNFHRSSEDVYDSRNNKTTADRVRNVLAFITAKIEEVEGYITSYTVFCTGHSLGGLFAEYLTLNCQRITQCETFNSVKENYNTNLDDE